jgi:thiamine biosynthesis lipoprotein
MRTRFEVVIADDGDPAALRAAGEEALDEITAAESLLSAFQDGAELRLLNQIAGHGIVAPSPLMLQFLRRCCALVEATDGTFDPAIGALLDCWRIQGDGSDQSEPEPTAIAQALAACDLRRQLLFDANERHLRFAHPTTRLDPGAVGKGWALDRAEMRLRDAGIRNALIHGGTSTACALGDETGRDGWTIALRDPRTPDAVLAQAHLRDMSLSVSGQHGRSVLASGRRVGHILDPRNGRPVEHTLVAAVIHPSALVSDALSTALLVLGAAGIAMLAERFPGAQFLLLASDGAKRTHGQAFQ